MKKTITQNMSTRAAEINSILDERHAGFTVLYSKNWKNNEQLECYVLRSEDSNCSPTVYKDDWFDATDAEVADYLTEMYRQHGCSDIDANKLIEHDFIISNIMPRLVSAANIPDLQEKGIAYHPYLDMAVIFYIPVESFISDASASVQVTDAILDRAGIERDEAYAAAVEHIDAVTQIKSMSEILSEMMGCEVPEEESMPMWVVSNNNKLQGAAAMLSHNVLTSVKDNISGKMAVLPSSVHEFIAVGYRDDADLGHMVEMVQDVNATQVSIQDKLTDSVYIYNDGELQIYNK